MNERSPTCLTEDDVLGLLDGRLDPVQRTEAERHLDACSECRRLVAESARSDASGEEAPRLGRYVITEVIGAGGMGLVYRAWDPDLRRSVAVKVVARERLAGRAPALLDEARAIASITHPNVIAVHDLSANDELVFFAMELVEGQNLRTWLAERRTWAESAAAFAQAARGLAAIHQAGLVHGDVKPDNILVGSDGRVRVGDFGLAAAEPPPDAPSLPTQDGTPRYLAPERLAGRPASARADQWALGLAIVEAISGGLDGAAVERLRRSGPASVLRGVPRRARPRRALARALASSLAPRPEDRLPSLTDLAAALEARPGGRRRAIGALGVCVAALAIGLALWRVGGADEPRSIARDALRPLDRWCWVERATYDLATTRTFYAALLGWRMDDAPHPRLSVYTTARNATGTIAGLYGLTEEQRQRGVPAHWRTYIRVDDAGAAIRRAVALGATLLGGPFDRPRGRLAVLRDPGGATLGVWQAGLENRATFAPGSAGGWGWFDRTVADPPAVATFYEGWLGWRSDASGPSDGRHLSRTLHVGNLAVAGVHRRTEPGDGDGSWVVYFDVPSCDDAIRRALTLGGRLIGRVSPGSPCRAVLSDPEDVPFGIQGPR